MELSRCRAKDAILGSVLQNTAPALAAGAGSVALTAEYL